MALASLKCIKKRLLKTNYSSVFTIVLVSRIVFLEHILVSLRNPVVTDCTHLESGCLILFYLFGRFWCRYLCPLGAIFGLFNRVSILKVKLDTMKCTNCKVCLSNCPVNIKKVDDIGKSSDCIQCAKCISECPTEALQVSASIRN